MAGIDTNIKAFDEIVQARIRANSTQIQFYSSLLGVPAEGIAGSAARE